ncbi:MAG: PAS domain S-box protein [Glaciecola sp.]
MSCWDSELNNVFNNDTHGNWFAHTHKRTSFGLSELFLHANFQVTKKHLTHLTNKNSVAFELSDVHFGSGLHYLRVSLLRERLVNGQVGFVMVLTDITDQQSKLHDLITDQKKYQTALTEIEEGVIVTDTSAHITYINRMAQELTGQLQNSALGKHIDEVMHIHDAVDGTTLDSILTTYSKNWHSNWCL